MCNLMKSFVIAFAGLLILPAAASAHKLEYAAIETFLSSNSDKTLSLSIRVAGPVYITDSPSGDKEIPPDDAAKFYQNYINHRLLITAQDKPCQFVLNSHNMGSVQFTLEGEYSCDLTIKNLQDLTIKNTLFNDHFSKYDNFVNTSIGNEKSILIFTNDKTEFPGMVEVAKSELSYNGFKPVILDFMKTGMLHIWEGYDHLLFLFAAILLLRKLKSILIVVTSFTIAHSITLSLAALGIFTLPSGLVEPVIVLSIIAVATRNFFILRKNEDKVDISERWSITFGFGLIHGLGFAGALKEAEIPNQYFPAALTSFNVGIELGQLAVMLFVVPILILLQKTKKRRLVLSLTSLFIALSATVMLIMQLES